MTLGTEQEREAVAQMVNKAHGPVRGQGYTAFDSDLQLWVAATLAHNGIFLHELVYGPMSTATKEQIYRDSQVFGTALQVRPEDWPATYADFEKYWDHMLATKMSSEPLVRLRGQAVVDQGPAVSLKPAVWLQNLVTKGNLTPEVHELLGLTWSWREQKLYDLFFSVHNIVYRCSPRSSARHTPG